MTSLTRTCQTCKAGFGPRNNREGKAFHQRLYCSADCYRAAMVQKNQSRFWTRVDRSRSGCWLWVGSIDANGYGRTNYRSLNARHAHRVAYILTYGSIPEGMHIDHLCRVRHCVNPDHLEAVEPAENTRRGLKSYAIRDTCKNGHNIKDEENVYTFPNGGRTCRKCMRLNRLERAGRYLKGNAAKIPCPSCGQGCHGVTGLKSHHYKSHGVPLDRTPGREPTEVGLP